MSVMIDQIRQLFEQGQYAQIVAAVDSSPASIDQLPGEDQERVAISLASNGRNADAEILLRRLVARSDRKARASMNLGVLLLNSGRVAEARPLLESACRECDRDANAWLNHGLAEFSGGAFELSARALERTLELEPANDSARIYLARSLQEMGRLDAANAVVRGWRHAGALALDELYELAQVLVATDNFERAEPIYQEILRLKADEHLARINLATLYERANRLESARQLLDTVPGESRQDPVYLLTRGKLLARGETPEQALELLDAAAAAAPADAGLAGERFRSEVEFERGRALDRLSRTEDAFSSFTEANRLARDAYRRFNPASTTLDGGRIDWLEDTPALDAAVARARTRTAETEAPIFLVGFPRSGTTLLDRMLDAHPALQVLEEKPALEALSRAVQGLREGYPAAIGALTQQQVLELRAGYWATVGQYLERRTGTRLVDKYPLNLGRLHLAMTVFPRAKWIFAIRHPADVVLSCFMQNFRFTDATHGFWSLSQSAALYEQIIGLWLEQRARLKPDCLDLRYEDLIADVETNFRRVLAFLDLPWDERVLGYRERAREQRISNPSYRQVIEPVYRTAEGRWLRYRRWLEPELERLAPLALRLGYPDPRLVHAEMATPA